MASCLARPYVHSSHQIKGWCPLLPDARNAIRPAFVALCLLAGPTFAADYSLSGYGTLGYAKSDRPYAYDRFIDNQGTLRKDSLVGLQLDSRFTNSFGATVQLAAAPASDDDSRYRATVSWAFLSWRPSNDWLFRFGKQRIPLYLYSQTYNVGVTHDFARLPVEMYSISPNNDLIGASFSKTWGDDIEEFSLEGILGKTDLDARVWLRDGIPGIVPAGSIFRHLAAKGGALSLVYKREASTYRLGIYRASLGLKNGAPIIASFPFVTIFPGVGYYQVDDFLPGPGVPQTKKFGFSAVSLGADIDLGSGYRVVGEFARGVINRTELDETANRGYLSVLKQIDHWTPYVTLSAVRSASKPLALNRAVNANTVPGFIPGANVINASQRFGSDNIRVQDQHSIAIGASYSLSATQKVKGELARVRIGRVSSLVDSPSGGDISQQNINVFSLSYSFVF